MAGDEMKSIVAALARIRPDTKIWFAAAVLLSAISAELTWWITSVERTPIPTNIQLGFDIKRNLRVSDVHSPTVVITSLARSFNILVEAIDRQKVVDFSFGPVLDGRERDVRCLEYANAIDMDESKTLSIAPAMRPASPYELSAAHVDAKIHSAVIVDVQVPTLPPGALSDVASIECDLPSPLVHDTYTSRSIEVLQRGWAQQDPLALMSSDPYGSNSIDPLSITVNDVDADEIHVTDLETGETRIASTFAMPKATVDSPPAVHAAGAKLKFRWESITAAQQRDIVIVIIGSLIALAAAALIEALRPYVDRLVHEPDSIGPSEE